MQRIAINAKVGGFEISHEAVYQLICLNNKHIKTYDNQDLNVLSYFKDGFYIGCGHSALQKEDIVYYYDDDFVLSRTNEDLINIVLNLGKKANTEYSDLKIIEIPENIKWYIRIFDDGTEEIHEEHRSWR